MSCITFHVKYFEEHGSESSISTLIGDGLFVTLTGEEIVCFFFFFSFPFPFIGEGDREKLGELCLIGEQGKQGELRCLIGDDRG